jgi:hypothetical protein
VPSACFDPWSTWPPACPIPNLTASDGKGNGGDYGSKGNGQSYTAPEFNFSGAFKYELLVIAGGAVLLLERRRRRRRASLDK